MPQNIEQIAAGISALCDVLTVGIAFIAAKFTYRQITEWRRQQKFETILEAKRGIRRLRRCVKGLENELAFIRLESFNGVDAIQLWSPRDAKKPLLEHVRRKLPFAFKKFAEAESEFFSLRDICDEAATRQGLDDLLQCVKGVEEGLVRTSKILGTVGSMVLVPGFNVAEYRNARSDEDYLFWGHWDRLRNDKRDWESLENSILALDLELDRMSQNL